jgi:hypothetical protein
MALMFLKYCFQELTVKWMCILSKPLLGFGKDRLDKGHLSSCTNECSITFPKMQGVRETTGRSTAGRSIRLGDMKLKKKDFAAPNEAFKVDKQLETEFLKENYGVFVQPAGPLDNLPPPEKVSVFDSGRRWGEALGTGVGTFLMSSTWCEPHQSICACTYF